MTTSSHLPSALDIIRQLTTHGYTALFAGGYVRDMVLKSTDKSDIDIATNATPQQVMSLFPQVVPVGEHFGVVIVVIDGIPFEVATFRKDVGVLDGRHPQSVAFTDAREDALRRDFTINGMFYDPLTERILDYVDGQLDCAAGVIRAIGDPAARFTEDYLRMIRAVRFSARFGFAIEPDTWNALTNQAGNILKNSAERIFAELDKIVCGRNAGRALELLRESGLLAHILPEVDALYGVEQPPQFHPEGDVFTHTVIALSLLNKPSQIVGWSALLHDIGKPKTMVIADRIRFSNHDNVGARMAEKILRRLKASVALIENVNSVVANHMNFMNVTKMRLSTLKKFLARPTLEDELELHRVDCMASHGDISNYDFIRQKQQELPVAEIKPVSLINGKDLIALGFVPGPLFGTIIGEAYDLQLENKLLTREESLEWVKDNYGEKNEAGVIRK